MPPSLQFREGTETRQPSFIKSWEGKSRHWVSQQRNYVSCSVTKHLLYLGTILQFSEGKSLPSKLLFTPQNPSASDPPNTFLLQL